MWRFSNEVEQKLYASLRRVRGLGYMTVPLECGRQHENDLFNMFSVFSNVVHILGVIPAYIVFCRTSIQCVALIENLPPRSNMGQQRVSNVTLINIERAYANSVVIDIFGRQNGKEGYFF